MSNNNYICGEMKNQNQIKKINSPCLSEKSPQGSSSQTELRGLFILGV